MHTTSHTQTPTLSSRLYPAGSSRQRAVLIRPDTAAHVLGIPTGLESLQATIGCRSLDVLSLNGGIDLWVDEEGLLQPAPRLNLAATLLAHSSGVGTAIFGTAVALSVEPTTGETLGISAAEADHVLTLTAEPAETLVRAVAATLSELLPYRR